MSFSEILPLVVENNTFEMSTLEKFTSDNDVPFLIPDSDVYFGLKSASFNFRGRIVLSILQLTNKFLYCMFIPVKSLPDASQLAIPVCDNVIFKKFASKISESISTD